MADLNDAVVHMKFITSQMYPEVQTQARNQILADLLVQIMTNDDAFWTHDWSSGGYLTIDGGIKMTPEQMAALEDAILEHKAKEE